MRRCLVTGGSGFLGRHLIDALLADDQPESEIVVFDLRPYQHHHPATSSRIHARTGTVTKLGDVMKACQDVDIVYHCVSADPLDDRNQKLMWSVNVEGTKNIIEACKQCCVPKLVYVSTASVIFDGTHMINADENTPYPTKYIDYYSMTKAEAEKLVLAANKATLLTCSLRPSSIFGERDPVFLPRLIDAGRTGKTKYIIGNGKTKWEFTYVGNIALACIKASDALSPLSPVAGSAYFITNDQTTLFWPHIGIIMEGLGFPKPSICIPYLLCYVLACIFEIVLFFLSPIFTPKRPPTFTRQRVQLMTTHRQLSCEKAKKDFGYQPAVSLEEATNRTIEYFKATIQEQKSEKKDE